MATKKKATKTMAAKPIKPKSESFSKVCSDSCSNNGGCIYFLGFVGAAIYYISTATSFWAGVLGILKAIVWPAMLVFKLLGM